MTDPAVWLPTDSGTMPAATAAADPADEPPGVRHRLADDDGTGRAQCSHACRVALGPPAGEERRAVLGRIVGGVEHVLDADRNAVEGAYVIAAGEGGIGLPRHGEGELGVEVLPGLHLGFAGVDARQRCGDELLG